jgi:endoglycosylceramidase
VVRAFENFYANTDGIQDELVNTWAAVASSFARDPAVAGYDLLNEPNWGADAATSGARLGAFTKRATDAIRDAEHRADGTSHIIFFEPVVLFPASGTLVPPDDATDPNMVFAPHNYHGSIDPGTSEDGFAAQASAAASYGVTSWTGEFGWFGDPAKNQSDVAQFAAQQDAARIGGTWWQWKQACGDPHSIGAREPAPADLIYQFNLIGCPGDHDQGPVPEWQPILARAYPRAAPGVVRTLLSDGLTGAFSMTGSRADAPPDATIDLWVPNRSGVPAVGGSGITRIGVEPVDGGFRVTASICRDDYRVEIGPGMPGLPTGSDAC